MDLAIAGIDICDDVDEDKEREMIDLMKQIEEGKGRKQKLDQAFEWLKFVLESAIDRPGNSDIVDGNFEDFMERYLNSCLEIM